MFAIIPWILSGIGLGSFIGAQVDDKLDTPPPAPESSFPPLWKIALYGAVGIGLALGAKKVLKK